MPLSRGPLVEDNARILVRMTIAGHKSLSFILDTAARGASSPPRY
jgi:hypothetical protein